MMIRTTIITDTVHHSMIMSGAVRAALELVAGLQSNGLWPEQHSAAAHTAINPNLHDLLSMCLHAVQSPQRVQTSTQIPGNHWTEAPTQNGKVSMCHLCLFGPCESVKVDHTMQSHVWTTSAR